MDVWRDARETGQATLEEFVGGVRSTLRERVRRSVGVRGTPPVTCEDPDESYMPVGGAARAVHGDLAAMLVGGIASLLLQMLHPLVMTGVAQHSKYREDPLGRLSRTASFVGATTYGSRADAARAVARVRGVHARVRGRSAEHGAYEADTPRLLEWVHVAELTMFLAGVRAYGPLRITPELADRYVDEMARVALDLGVSDPPRTEAQLMASLDSFRDELTLIPEALEARDFVVHGVSRRPTQRAAYRTLVAGGIGVLPGWARRDLRFADIPLSDELIVRPAATLLCSTLRFAVPPAR